ARADDERRVGERRLERLIAGNVVDVTVRVEDYRWRKALGAEPVQERVRLEAGVNHDRIVAPDLPNDAGVLGERHRLDHGNTDVHLSLHARPETASLVNVTSPRPSARANI